MKISHIAISGFLVLLGGCSGFMLQSEKESVITESISSSNFTVTFCGNAYMNQGEAEKYAMQRACELTLTKGYSHFVILSKTDQSQICALQDAPLPGYSSGKQPAAGTASPQSIIRPNLTLKIQCFKPTDAPKEAIDAQKYIDDNFPGLKFTR